MIDPVVLARQQAVVAERNGVKAAEGFCIKCRVAKLGPINASGLCRPCWQGSGGSTRRKFRLFQGGGAGKPLGR